MQPGVLSAGVLLLQATAFFSQAAEYLRRSRVWSKPYIYQDVKSASLSVVCKLQVLLQGVSDRSTRSGFTNQGG